MEAVLQELNLRELNLQDWASANPSLSPQRQAPSGGCLCLHRGEEGACGCIYIVEVFLSWASFRNTRRQGPIPSPQSLGPSHFATPAPTPRPAVLALRAPTSRPRAPIPAPKAPAL